MARKKEQSKALQSYWIECVYEYLISVQYFHVYLDIGSWSLKTCFMYRLKSLLKYSGQVNIITCLNFDKFMIR